MKRKRRYVRDGKLRAVLCPGQREASDRHRGQVCDPPPPRSRPITARIRRAPRQEWSCTVLVAGPALSGRNAREVCMDASSAAAIVGGQCTTRGHRDGWHRQRDLSTTGQSAHTESPGCSPGLPRIDRVSRGAARLPITWSGGVVGVPVGRAHAGRPAGRILGCRGAE